MQRYRLGWLLVLGVSALLISAMVRKPKEAGTPNPWCQSTPGSWVIMRTVVKQMAAKNEQTERVVEEKFTLLELTAGKVILEQTTSPNTPEALTQRVEAPRFLPSEPAANKRSDIANEPEFAAAIAAAAQMEIPVAEGEETLTIDGRPVRTHWIQYGMGALTKKQWTSAAVPGPWCKLLIVMDLGDGKHEMLTEVIAFERK